nr:MAG TPA: hypothetical protein [Caudoviricetes sp.]
MKKQYEIHLEVFKFSLLDERRQMTNIEYCFECLVCICR